MAKFQCMNCSFKYLPKNAAAVNPPVICPNCGKRGRMVKYTTSSDILRDTKSKDE